MIIDRITEAKTYNGLIKNLDQALRFLEEHPTLVPGKHVFPGGYLIVVEGQSQPLESKDYEVHHAYTDVMFVMKGKEEVAYANYKDLAEVSAYDAEADCQLYAESAGTKGNLCEVQAGYFYVMSPHEAHKPCIHARDPYAFKKYIIKCRQID